MVQREMANEKKLQTRKVIELEQVDVERLGTGAKDTEETPAVVSIKKTTTTTSLGKRGRETGNEQKLKKHGEKHLAVYGNYHKYYGYRVLKYSDEDPRLKYFKHEWFEGRDCLDVGCNAGNLTISIAKKFCCKTMVGVDIDSDLVYKARALLEKTATSLVNMHTKKGSDPKVKMLNEENIKAASRTSSIEHTTNIFDNELNGEELLQRVSFKAVNFISCMEGQPTYDTVLCLSVTKWVHLNWGDVGLIKLFAKIRNLLRPGGILVLEPQPWKSYKNNHTVSEVVRQNFHEIVLRPDQFREVLLDRIGFRSMESITENIESCAEGFSRPIYLLRC